MYKKTLALLSVLLLSNYVDANSEITHFIKTWNAEEDVVINSKPLLVREDGETGEFSLHHNGETDVNDDPKKVLGDEIPIIRGEVLPVIGGEDLPIVGGESLPTLGGEAPVLGGESAPHVGEVGEEVEWPSAGANGGEGEIEVDGDDGGSIIGSITDILATSNSDDKACIEDDNCLRNAQYCDSDCCFYKVCEGAKCGVNKIC